MKGQADIMSKAVSVVIVVVLLIVGSLVYFSTANVHPHDQAISNETICTTCSPHTTYAVDFPPLINDSTLICYNTSIQTLTRGGTFNTVNNNLINLTNSTDADYGVINCSYTFNEANANEQGIFDNSAANSSAAFILLSVAAIVIAAVAIITLVLLMKA